MNSSSLYEFGEGQIPDPYLGGWRHTPQSQSLTGDACLASMQSMTMTGLWGQNAALNAYPPEPRGPYPTASLNRKLAKAKEWLSNRPKWGKK